MIRVLLMESSQHKLGATIDGGSFILTRQRNATLRDVIILPANVDN